MFFSRGYIIIPMFHISNLPFNILKKPFFETKTLNLRLSICVNRAFPLK